jgi:hypothetical protein
MEHECCADDCPDSHIEKGEQAVQLLRGPWYGAITPGFTRLEREWHKKCFHEFSLRFYKQHLPYHCESDGKKIKFGEEIYFFVVGAETDDASMVCEARGYEIYHVTHVHCPNLPLNKKQPFKPNDSMG